MNVKKTVAGGLLLLCTALPAGAQEPQINSHAKATLRGCVEREEDYRARTGIVSAETPGTTGPMLVLTGATGTLPPDATPVNLSGDYLLTGSARTEIASSAGTQIEVVGYVEDFTVRLSADKVALPRRVVVADWRPAGGCAVRR